MAKRKRPKCSSFLETFFLALLLGIEGSAGQQRFANEPSPQTAVIGSVVVLPCRIINKVGELQWTRDGFGLGNERELFAFKRYGMIGADEEGDFSLQISPVTLEDDAEFQCQVTGWKDVKGVRSQTAKLTVYVPPKPPEIIQGPVIETTAGAGVQLECLSKEGKPAAEIQWLDSSERVILDGVKFKKELLKDGHRYDSRSTLTFIAGREHHNGVFTCTATNPALHQSLKTQVRLEVTFPPEVIIIHDKENGYKEGDTATLCCSAIANPNDLSFRWYKSGNLVSNANQTKLIVKDVTRHANLEDITCEVSNSVGTSKKITRLAVHYGPSFRVAPKDVFAEEGENATLRCQVDGSPEPKILWIPQKNSSFIYGTGPTLTLKATQETIGTYQCLVKVEDFPEISMNVGLFLKVPPNVKAEKLQWGILSDTAHVECFVPSATPNSVEVTWLKGHWPLDVEQRRYSIEKDAEGDGVLIRLVIRGMQPEDFDTYNCSVQNAFGSDMVQVLLRRKETLPLMVIISCVVGGSAFILTIAAAVIIYRKKKASGQKDAKIGGLQEKSVSLHTNDQNSTGNQCEMKVELANRTGSSMSTKEADLAPTWEKDGDNPDTSTYLSSTASYLYPENFTGIPLKVNGHVATPSSYGDYGDQSCLTGKSNTSQTLSLQGAYSTSGGSFSPRGHHPPMVTSNQHNLFSAFHKEYEVSGPTESVEGLRGLSSTYSNGYASQNFKNNTSTMPLSLHISRNGTASPSSAPNMAGSALSHHGLSAVNTIPRLGIPVDPSQYIVPPRTQVLQGALATHV